MPKFLKDWRIYAIFVFVFATSYFRERSPSEQVAAMMPAGKLAGAARDTFIQSAVSSCTTTNVKQHFSSQTIGM